MYRKRTVIVIEADTRTHMKEVAKKSQTYDDLINELLALKEQGKLSTGTINRAGKRMALK